MFKYLISLTGFSFYLMMCSFSYQGNIGFSYEPLEQFVWSYEDTSLCENPEQLPEFIGGEKAM